MDYKELMCGDWVKVEQVTEVVNAKVLGVYKDGINYEVDYSGVRATNQIHTDYVSPIELTEEILVKNGFDFTKRNYGVCCKEDKYGDVELSKDKNGFYWSINTDEYEILRIDYVHQLQHILTLSGVQKEIEL